MTGKTTLNPRYVQHGLFNIYRISANSFLPWIVSAPQWGNYSSFHYIRENLMRKPCEILKVLKIQKRIVSSETNRGNTVMPFWHRVYMQGPFGKDTKGVFFSESEICFSNLQISEINYSKSLSWTWNLKLPPITVNNLFKFQAQGSDLD